MLTLLEYSIMFIIGYAGFIKALWSMMQSGAAFDVVSGGKWSKFRERLYGGKAKHQLLENILGGCEQCTSFWWSWLWVVIYVTFCICTDIWVGVCAGCIWAFVFGIICSLVGNWVLTYKRKQDGV